MFVHVELFAVPREGFDGHTVSAQPGGAGHVASQVEHEEGTPKSREGGSDEHKLSSALSCFVVVNHIFACTVACQFVVIFVNGGNDKNGMHYCD